MIPINELRVGNWVYHSQWALEPTKVECINSEGIQQHRGDGYVPDYWPHIDDIIPIPLTPEILEKCWFVQSMEAGFFLHWPDEDLELRIYNDKYYFQPDHCLMPVDDRWEVKSLHQLQNLYFALTQTELNYTP